MYKITTNKVGLNSPFPNVNILIAKYNVPTIARYYKNKYIALFKQVHLRLVNFTPSPYRLQVI